MNRDNQIQEEIDNMGMDEQQGEGYNIEFQESAEKSVQFTASSVNFKKHGVILNKFGAIKAQQNSISFYINSDFIKLHNRIGKGSAGQVYQATYIKDQKDIIVAVKQIPVDQKQSRDQFVQDLKVFINSNSPYVVKFYGCFYKQGYLSQVIEYMNMGSLRDIINFNTNNNNVKPLQSVLAQFSSCILQGLNYIHKEKHQVHRDIKPQNILVNSAGEVKITDFGICKQLEKTYGLSRTWVGTQIYMSPERIQGKQYPSNCDVWSFGLILYELATNNKLPYSRIGISQYALIKKIKDQPVPTFSPEDGRSPQLSHFLSRCLQKDCKKRAQVSELLQHPWLVNNNKQNILKKYIKMIDKQLKKIKKNP